MELESAEVDQDEGVREEELIVQEYGGPCQNFEGSGKLVNVAQSSKEFFQTVAEGAKKRFFDYNAMKWIACNLQYNLSLATSLRRWAIVENVHAAISELARLGEVTTESDVWKAKFKAIPEFILLKTSKLYSDDAHMYHEFFVGSMFLNSLREHIPHFMYTYAIFKCSRPRFDPELPDFEPNTPSRFCEYTKVTDISDLMSEQEKRLVKNQRALISEYRAEGNVYEVRRLEAELQANLDRFAVESENYLDNPVNYLVIENVPGGLSLSRYIRRDQPQFSSVVGYLLQIVSALEMAFERFDFCHYDMHTNNILLRLIAGPRKRTFVPVGYSKLRDIRYFIETPFIPTIIDFGRSHVQWLDPLRGGKPKNFGNHLFEGDGVYYNASRPVYDIYKLVGHVTMDLLHKYDAAIPTARSTRINRKRIEMEENVIIIDNRATALSIVERITTSDNAQDLWNIINLWNFFPFFREVFEDAATDKQKAYEAILFILNESSEPDNFNLKDKWIKADTKPGKYSVHEDFVNHLRTTFVKDVDRVLFRGESLPKGANISIYSCEFNQCNGI
jgi:hypothetical protein